MVSRIVHLVSGKRFTGAASVALSWHEALRHRGLESRFLYMGGYTLEEKLRGRQDCIPYPGYHSISRFVTRETKNALVFAHISQDHWFLSLLARKSAKRILVFHRPAAVKTDWIHRRIYQRCDAAIPAFPGTVNLSCLPVLPWIPPAVNTDIFTPGTQPHDPPVLGTIGKLTRDRHHERFIYLLDNLQRRGVPFRAKVIGKGPHLSFLMEETNRCGLDPVCSFVGYHEDDALAKELGTCDLFIWCMPGSQGSHRALPEAMLCGCAAAAFPMEGLEPWIEDGKTGLRLSSHMEEAADKLIPWLQNRESLRILAEQGRSRVLERTSYDSIADRIEEILSKIET
ncbi:MAG TPA: glycosyltransferase family 4 protein [Thermoanaerobaculia bacterium]|nr:glycosyltransferase family 4 protein [Thermoanaerobaculia bacterium]HUM29272.1 glycosyltransferase family 4 protein [Thermoanaerobaculia bacterium]HXK67770.1 glycosyltransferase family 4 protein [Thermoanaerobaculia bacterium]